MNKFTIMFKALGNQTRLRIFLMLKQRSLCVCEIQKIIGCSMATLSNHLKLLKDAELIGSNKEFKFINYHLNMDNPHVEQLLNIMIDLKDLELATDEQMVKTVDRKIICGHESNRLQ